jgi:preprotein translocase subunit SecG
MSILLWVLGGLALVLVGFIVLQRRNPAEADKIASGLDAAVKAAEQKAADVFKKK